MGRLSELILGESDLRKIARNELWRAFWSAKGSGLFEAISDEQINLISWTKLYNSVHEHPECPDTEVIEDDDMFDGWLIKNRREKEKDYYQKKAEGLASKHGGAGEIYVPVDPEDLHKVARMNSEGAQRTKESRFKAINEAGALDDLSLPDKQMELQMAINRAQHGRK